MKDFARVICALLAVALLGACGGGSSGAAMTTPPASVPADTRLVLDAMAWDQGDWAE